MAQRPEQEQLLGISGTGARLYGPRTRPRAETELTHPTAVVAVHHLSRHAAAGILHDIDGKALARLGVDDAAQYLVRPAGHIGYRSSGTGLHGLERYLARWLPGRQRERSPL
jgi:hypothetical protein